MLTWLQRDSLQFPPLAKAMREPNGLLAAGGDLSADRLISAYRHGCGATRWIFQRWNAPCANPMACWLPAAIFPPSA